jgi:hypothetical protein
MLATAGVQQRLVFQLGMTFCPQLNNIVFLLLHLLLLCCAQLSRLWITDGKRDKKIKACHHVAFFHINQGTVFLNNHHKSHD